MAKKRVNKRSGARSASVGVSLKRSFPWVVTILFMILMILLGGCQPTPAPTCDPPDVDCDGVEDSLDNCKDVANLDQKDDDVDGIGDVCDNCPGNNNPGQLDSDDDGFGDTCDNCPNVAYSQIDSDDDGVGNVCDNCPAVYNPDQVMPGITLDVSDGGRTLITNCPVLMPVAGSNGDEDGDGLLDAFEFSAVGLLNPYIELDEDEDWVEFREDYPKDNVVNFTRITLMGDMNTWQQSGNLWVLIFNVITWTRDYGRHLGISGHPGDTERIIEAWQVVTPDSLSLEWVYTSAHTGTSTDHSGVWHARGISRNTGHIKGGGTEEMSATLQFTENRLYVFASEDKHALYPTIEVCESISLVPPIGEHCGGGSAYLFDAIDTGEPDECCRRLSNVSNWFPGEYGEYIWSGDDFCGGLGCGDGGAESIGARLREVPAILCDKLGVSECR